HYLGINGCHAFAANQHPSTLPNAPQVGIWQAIAKNGNQSPRGCQPYFTSFLISSSTVAIWTLRLTTLPSGPTRHIVGRTTMPYWLAKELSRPPGWKSWMPGPLDREVPATGGLLSRLMHTTSSRLLCARLSSP